MEAIQSIESGIKHARSNDAIDDLNRSIARVWGSGGITDTEAQTLFARARMKRPPTALSRHIPSISDLTKHILRRDGIDQQKPLSLRFETKHQWAALSDEFGCDKTGAAVILDIVHHGDWVSYSRRRDHYNRPDRYKSPLYTYLRIVGAVDALAGAGLIDSVISSPHQRGWQSAMRARPELIERTLKALAGNLPMIALPPEMILLRSDDGKLLDYTDTDRIRRQRRRLEAYNQAVASCDIRGAQIGPVVRIYNGTFERGGRAYVMGGGWQTISKADRGQITIDGEGVAEPDYKTIHPAILYARENARTPQDCYNIGAWPRTLVKRALLILINAKGHKAALGAIAHDDSMAEVAEPGTAEAFTMAERLIADVKRVHAPIAHYFHSDAGAWLQAVDAGLAEEVTAQMLRQGSVVLPIHDSFLCQKSKADDVREAMLKAAHKAGFPSLMVA